MKKALLTLAALFLASASQAQPVSPIWSKSATTKAPGNGARYHGPFQAQSVAVLAKQLPAHSWVRLKFKLYIAGSWDGSSPVWGPDLWSLQVRGAQRLCFATFGTMGDFTNNNLQSYPDEYPWGKHKAWTGAAERNVLGFPAHGAPTTTPNLTDAVYPTEMLFPHTGRSLVLDFAGIYNDPPQERQSWGIGSLQIEVLRQPPTVSDEELPQSWEKLAADDPVQANQALWKLVAAGDRALGFLKTRVEELAAEAAGGSRPNPPFKGLEALRLHRAHRVIQILGRDRL
jgi:hypothetical protein